MMKQAVLRKTLTGGWTEFKFPQQSRFFFVKNFTEGDVLVSFANGDAESESVKIQSNMGEEGAISFCGTDKSDFYTDTIYVKGTGEVEVQALDVCVR